MVQVDFWGDDFLMQQAVLDISYVDGSGSPVSTKFAASFHGCGEPVVIEVLEIDVPEIAPSGIAPDEDFSFLMR